MLSVVVLNVLGAATNASLNFQTGSDRFFLHFLKWVETGQTLTKKMKTGPSFQL
jgi:hypothetical protein